jgi:Yip1 domain
VEKLKYFFVNPNKLFEDYNIRPTWFLKTLIIVALTMITTIITTKLIAGPTIDMMILQTPDLTREQAEAIMKSPLVMGFAAGGALLMPTAAIFLGSLIYYGLISLFGGKTKYMKIVAVYTLAYIPYTIGTLISLGFAYYTNNFDSMMQPKLMDVIFNRLDVFVIWQVLLLVFGFAKISNIKLHKSAIIVAIMWTIATLISLVPVFTNRLF